MQDLVERRPGFPRPVGPSLSTADLRPADVLLSRGEGLLADTIVAADGGSYSHAALWSGQAVIEAREDGVRERPLGAERDVYRFCRADPPFSGQVAARVIANARARIEAEYAFSELFLLGTLFALGIRPGRSVLHGALELLGGTRAERLERWLVSLGASSQPVICSELVASAFFEASSGPSYALAILPRSARPKAAAALRGVGAPSTMETERASAALGEACLNLLRMEAAPQARCTPLARKVLFGSIAVQAGSTRRLGTVSPADLQFSPTLRFLGCVRSMA